MNKLIIAQFSFNTYKRRIWSPFYTSILYLITVQRLIIPPVLFNGDNLNQKTMVRNSSNTNSLLLYDWHTAIIRCVCQFLQSFSHSHFDERQKTQDSFPWHISQLQNQQRSISTDVYMGSERARRIDLFGIAAPSHAFIPFQDESDFPGKSNRHWRIFPKIGATYILCVLFPIAKRNSLYVDTVEFIFGNQRVDINVLMNIAFEQGRKYYSNEYI